MFFVGSSSRVVVVTIPKEKRISGEEPRKNRESRVPSIRREHCLSIFAPDYMSSIRRSLLLEIEKFFSSKTRDSLFFIIYIAKWYTRLRKRVITLWRNRRASKHQLWFSFPPSCRKWSHENSAREILLSTTISWKSAPFDRKRKRVPWYRGEIRLGDNDFDFLKPMNDDEWVPIMDHPIGGEGRP